MDSKNFELMGGYLGNGLTLFNKAEREADSYDYKVIGHISPGGHISWRCDSDYIKAIPVNDYLKILDWSVEAKKNFRHSWFELPELERYMKILDRVYKELYRLEPWRQLLDEMDLDDGPGFHTKFVQLEEYYLNYYA